MRIGVSALFQAQGGVLIYLRHLVEEWTKMGVFDTHDVALFTSHGTLERLGAEIPRRAKVVVLNRADRGLLGRMVVEQTELVKQVERHGLHVLLCPANTMPLAVDVPCVTAFTNAAPFCPSISPRSVGIKNWARFAILGLSMRVSAKRASRVVFHSQFLRDLFVSRFGLDPEKGAVIYRARDNVSLGANEDFQLEQHLGIRRPYVLCVSHLYRYKNILELIEGFAMACLQHGIEDRQLVIAGAEFDSHYSARVRSLARGLDPTGGKVVLTGAISHRQVGSLLAGCESFAFPSTCENSPNALIEALSMGVPVACSNVGAMPEVAGDAAHYFDPYDPADIARSLGKLMTDAETRRELGSRGTNQVQRYPSRTEVAQQTLAVLEQAAGRATGGTGS